MGAGKPYQFRRVDSRKPFGTSPQGGSSPEITFMHRELSFWWLAYAIALRLVWVTAWASLTDFFYATTRSRFGRHHCTTRSSFTSAHTSSELSLLREPLSAATEKHVRKLESSGGFSCSKMNPAFVKSDTSQMTSLGESNSAPSYVRQFSREGVKNEWKHEKTDGAG